MANDGAGTELLSQTSPLFFKTSFPPPLGPLISSPTHPDEERWYRDNNPIFIWSKSPRAEAYSFNIDRDPNGVPGTKAVGTGSTASFTGLGNGIWYFHLREKANGVWGGASHRAVKIDNEAPAQFRINISPSSRTSNRSPIFRFFTTDALSGFDHWEMKMISLSSEEASQALFFNVDSPYQALNLKPGRYQVVARAYDEAKNTRDETATLTIYGAFTIFDSEGINLYFAFLSWGKVALGILILFLIFLYMMLRLWFKHRHHVKNAFAEDMGRVSDFLKKFKRKNKNDLLKK